MAPPTRWFLPTNKKGYEAREGVSRIGYNEGMIGRNDDRGRIIFGVILAFALLGKFLPKFTGLSRADAQSGLAIALVPAVFWVFWSLRHPRPSIPETGDPAAADAPSSEIEETDIN